MNTFILQIHQIKFDNNQFQLLCINSDQMIFIGSIDNIYYSKGTFVYKQSNKVDIHYHN